VDSHPFRAVQGTSLQKRLQAFIGFAKTLQAPLAANHDQAFKERRRILASADGDADRLKHRPGLQAQISGCRAQCMIQRVVIEAGCGKNFLSVLEDAARHRRIAALGRNQLGWIVGRQFLYKEEIGGGRSFAEQFDALPDKRSDGSDLFRRSIKAGLDQEGRKLAAEFINAEGANVLGVEPYGLGIERVCFGEVDHSVGAIDVFERKDRADLVERQRKLMKALARNPASR